MGNGCQDLTALNSLLVRCAYLSYKKKKHLESRHRQLRKHSTSLSENGGILSLSGRASETHPRPCKQCSACQENKTCTATATFFYCQSQTRDITSTQGACKTEADLYLCNTQSYNCLIRMWCMSGLFYLLLYVINMFIPFFCSLTSVSCFPLFLVTLLELRCMCGEEC